MGFDVTLVDATAKKESNVCPHCHLILDTPMQTEEGIRLCKGCLEQIKIKPGGRCNCCDVTVKEGQYYPDRAALREVNAILVLCRHKKFGCSWQGRLELYKSHVAGCEFAGVSCPNAGCHEMVLAIQLQSHLAQCLYRLVTCSHCQEKLVAKDLEGHHSSSCRMYPVDCERCGEKVVHRHLLNHHLQHSCRLEECLVCNSLVDRKTSKHVGSSGDLSHSSSSSSTATDDSSKSQSATPSGGQGGKKSGPRSKQKQQRKGEKSSAVATTEEREEGQGEEDGGYHLGHPTAVFRHVQTLATQQELLRTDMASLSRTTVTRLTEAASRDSHGNEELDEGVIKLIGRLEDQLKAFGRQMETERNNRIAVEERMNGLTKEMETVREWEGGGEGHVRSRLMMLEQRTEQQERETSTLKVNMSELELQLQASLASTHNGSFLWRIPEVARRRRDAIDERITSIYSPPFYSGQDGYKMCIRAYLNGVEVI
ncbi:TNF receptor-associated factor 3 [Geodia barretti]|uniref:TNF receptor-associated factor 3 n=2 Tax=Geodia barretti TaxID=519541 RepID=A0AA35SDQ8_GEOBA|nr:TNF receptor-associated factor 3 [Geodia barretti]